MPSKPGSSSKMRRSTATERTDFEAMRIGLPAAWASMKRAFASSASRSTKAKGAVTESKIAS